MAVTTKKFATAKKFARPPLKPPQPDVDPLGLFPALSEQLKQAYHAQVRALLRKFDLIKFEPGVRRRIRAAETASEGPVTFLVALTVHPSQTAAAKQGPASLSFLELSTRS
jgi:hypothetical protein